MQVRVTRITLIYISLIILGLIFTSQSMAEIDPATVAGMWLFDDGAGDVATDASGNGLDADLIDGPQWVAGKFGGALEFDGGGAHVVIPDHENPTEAITVSAWVKSNTDTWNVHGWMFEKRDAYMLHPVEADTTVGWIFCNGACWNQPFDWTTGSVGPDDITEWHMYTGTFDSTTGDWKLYIDGQVESTLELNPVPINVDTGPVYIGNDT
jgi:hypothetical protein